MTTEKIKSISDMIGHTVLTIEQGDDSLTFEMDSGERCCFYHSQDCCESVTIEDICGNLDDLIGSPLTMAEESVSENENPEGATVPDYQESFTWTFYRFATAKGYVTVRWYGESNGYYSESVNFDVR